MDAVDDEPALVDDRAEDVGHLPGPREVAFGQGVERRLAGLVQEVDPVLLVLLERDVLLTDEEVGRVVRGQGLGAPLDADRAGELHQRRQGDRVDDDDAVDRLASGLGVELGHHLGHRRSVRAERQILQVPGRLNRP